MDANQIGNVVLYDYDSAGRRTNEVYMGVSTNSFAFDSAGSLRVLTDGKSQTTSWGFDVFEVNTYTPTKAAMVPPNLTLAQLLGLRTPL